mmetsp:Transcript_45584/g.73481  ORF Transcript_45584/g.73481 Transcript_45584/m.73481 type:complete len:272 (-) Transcript_45584:740-1555(-)
MPPRAPPHNKKSADEADASRRGDMCAYFAEQGESSSSCLRSDVCCTTWLMFRKEFSPGEKGLSRPKGIDTQVRCGEGKAACIIVGASSRIFTRLLFAANSPGEADDMCITPPTLVYIGGDMGALPLLGDFVWSIALLGDLILSIANPPRCRLLHDDCTCRFGECASQLRASISCASMSCASTSADTPLHSEPLRRLRTRSSSLSAAPARPPTPPAPRRWLSECSLPARRCSRRRFLQGLFSMLAGPLRMPLHTSRATAAAAAAEDVRDEAL